MRLIGIAEMKIEEAQDRVENPFMIPYDRNPRFTGRTHFLQMLKERLFDQVPKEYNHRIALYGMGGIGKTQASLEYAYTSKTTYKGIYWVTAANQASLLAGYQNIAKCVQLKFPPETNAIEIAKMTFRWLERQESGLVIIDNLDDISIVKGLLPSIGPLHHTLITTRNPNSDGIPAEGIEVQFLTSDEALELLSTLSKIEIVPNTPEWEQATRIVIELGHLPLAIEQAAAYVREVAGDFVTFLDDYAANQ